MVGRAGALGEGDYGSIVSDVLLTMAAIRRHGRTISLVLDSDVGVLNDVLYLLTGRFFVSSVC